MRFLRFLIVCGVLVVLFSFGAEAVPIPASSSVGAPPGMIGTGLDGEYYNEAVTSTGAASSVISNNAPSYIFHSTLLDYPRGNDGTTLNSSSVGSFLGPDDPGISDLFGGSVFFFSGFVEIVDALDVDVPSSEIDVNFGIKADDEFRMTIGGVTVMSFSGERQFSDPRLIGLAINGRRRRA